MSQNISCAGCIVFRQIEDVWHVCLVQTHRGVYGFPKGKKHKGELLSSCALRELAEETGITSDKISPLDPDKYIDEESLSGNPRIRLFITQLTHDVSLIPVDPEEIKSCEFLPIEKALTLLSAKRQKVLKLASLYLKDCVWNPGQK